MSKMLVIVLLAILAAGCESKHYTYTTPAGVTIGVKIDRAFMDMDLKDLYVSTEKDGSIHLELGDQSEKVRADALIKAMMIGVALSRGGDIPVEFWSTIGGAP